MEYWKDFFELVSSIFFLFAAIIAMNAFKYKYDSNIRDLYIDNCKKIKEVLRFASDGNITPKIIGEIIDLRNDAEIYLHKDVIDFVNKTFDSLCDLQCYEGQLTGMLEQKEKIQINELCAQEKLKISKLLRKAANVYRKHIIQSPMEKIKIRLQELVSWLKSKAQRWVDPETSSG